MRNLKLSSPLLVQTSHPPTRNLVGTTHANLDQRIGARAPMVQDKPVPSCWTCDGGGDVDDGNDDNGGDGDDDVHGDDAGDEGDGEGDDVDGDGAFADDDDGHDEGDETDKEARTRRREELLTS